MHSDTATTDVAIVGAGPIGLELAVALKKRGIGYLHFDARQIGYTISWFAPQTQFFSSNERIAIAGVPLHTPNQAKATREQYLTYLRTIVELFDLKVNTYEPVIGIARRDDRFVLTTRPRNAQATRTYHCRNLVVCTGGADRPRRLNIPGEDLPHVSHYLGDPHTYFRKDLLIVGGMNSAIEAALRCHHAGARVSLSYRREALPEESIKYWLVPEIKLLTKSERVKAYYQTVPISITPSQVVLARGGERIEVPADFVLLLIGYEQDNTLFKLAGVQLHGTCGAPVYDEQTMQTNVPGLYVAGTAVGGTQEKYSVFIENCHVHVDRIVSALTGAKPPSPAMTSAAVLDQPES
jgi:thioredoxin reductase (NADPH)